MSKQNFVESAVVKVADSPMDEQVIGEVCLGTDSGETYYVTLMEVYSLANFYLTKESVLNTMPSDEEELENFFEDLNGNHLLASGEYEDIFAQPDEQWHQVFRYLIYLVRCAPEEEDAFINATVGHRISDLEIPLSDVEEDFLGVE